MGEESWRTDSDESRLKEIWVGKVVGQIESRFW